MFFYGPIKIFSNCEIAPLYQCTFTLNALQKDIYAFRE